MPALLNPTTLLSPNDWVVEVVFVALRGREHRKMRGTWPGWKNEEEAMAACRRDLYRKGIPFVVKHMRAKRSNEWGIEKTIRRAQILTERFSRREP